jgi:peptidoglycan/LPS O-acetylase OafA/YrhL
LYVFVPVLNEGSHMQPAWRFLTFTMNFGLDYRATGAFTQAWSLCVEEHFYLLLPLLVLIMSRVRWRGWVFLLIGGVLFGGLLLRALLWFPVAATAAAQGANHQFAPSYMEAIYYPTYCRLDGLLFGVLLAAYRCFYPEHWRRYADPRLALLLGVTAIALAGFLFYFPATSFVGGPSLTLAGATVGYPLFSLGCACLLSASLSWEQWFSNWRVPGAAAIAALSYSLYLSHKMTNHAAQLLFDPQDLAGASGLAIYYGSSIVVAAALWAMVERPFLRLRERLLRR